MKDSSFVMYYFVLSPSAMGETPQQREFKPPKNSNYHAATKDEPVLIQGLYAVVEKSWNFPQK